MVARFLLFRRQSPVGIPQQPYWQARLQKEVLVDYRLERLLHGGVEAGLTQLAHALDGRAAGGAHRVHECDWVLGAVHSKRAAAHNRRGGDLPGDQLDDGGLPGAGWALRQSVTDY